MTNIKIYYLLNMDNDCIYHTTNQDEFIESALRYLKRELFEVAENYKTYVINIVEFLEEMEKLNTIRKDLEMCDNMEDLKNIANELDFKVKTKTIDLN